MTKLHLIELKGLPATNTKGSRLKITSQKSGKSVTLPLDYSYATYAEQCEAFLISKGFNIVGYLLDGARNYIISDSLFADVK